MYRHLGSLLVFTGLVLLLSVARWDRGRTADVLTIENRRIVNPQPAVGMPPGAVIGPAVAPAADGAAKADSDETIAKAAEARRELARVTDELAKKKKEIAQLEKKPARPQMIVDEAFEERRRLEKRVEELESGLQAAEKKAVESEQAVDALKKEQRARMAAAAEASVARTLGRGALLDAQARFDPRRFRDPALPPYRSTAAAIAAAGASASSCANGRYPPSPSMFAGSTAAGDISRGNAALVNAAGQYNLLSSQAGINMQTAQSLATENRLRATETFFEMRRVNRTARALELGPRPTMQQVVRYARMGIPPRLDSRQLDPVTGEIAWPLVLKDEVYRDDTAYIQKCFHERADSAGLSFQQFTLMDGAMESLKESLKQNVDKYPAARYGQARTFLDSLEYEFQLPVN